MPPRRKMHITPGNAAEGRSALAERQLQALASARHWGNVSRETLASRSNRSRTVDNRSHYLDRRGRDWMPWRSTPAGEKFHVKHCARDPPAGDAKRQAAQVPARRAPNYNLKYLWDPNLTTSFLCTNGMVVGRMFHVKHSSRGPFPLLRKYNGAHSGGRECDSLGGPTLAESYCS